MRKRSSKQKNIRDINVLASNIVEQATGQSIKQSSKDSNKNPAAVALGRLGGLKGGKARAKRLTSARRAEIAKKAALTMWSKVKV
jgi:hypothetical protein